MDSEKVIIFQRTTDKSDILIFRTTSKRRAALAFANILVEHQHYYSVKEALAFIYDTYLVREDVVLSVD